MNLPSQKLFFVAIPLVIIVGAFVMFKKPTTDNPQPTNDSIKTVSVRNAIINEADSDRDGLKDWEELIWKTDPNNPNTYDDVSDSDYVKAQLEKGVSGGSAASGPITSTEDLGEQLFAEYVALKQDGQINSISINQLTGRLANSISTNNEISFYENSSVKSFADSNKSAVENYAEKMTRARAKYAQLFISASGGISGAPGDEIFSENLLIASKLYSDMAKEIMSFDVPSGAVASHVNYANSLLMSSAGIKKLAQIREDPLQALVGVQQHTQGQELQSSSITSLSNFMSFVGILNFSLEIL